MRLFSVQEKAPGDILCLHSTVRKQFFLSTEFGHNIEMLNG